MIKRIELKNFKCFSKMGIDFKPISILCGVNSGGKSSIIQALLLGIESIETETGKGNIDLMNSKYNMNLYSFEEILYDDADKEKIEIMLHKDNNSVISIEYTSEESDNNLKFDVVSTNMFQKPTKRVWYLSSERTIAQYQKRGNFENLELGRKNEYIAYILERGRSNKLQADSEK